MVLDVRWWFSRRPCLYLERLPTGAEGKMYVTYCDVQAGAIGVMRRLWHVLWPVALADIAVHILGLMFVQKTLPAVAETPIVWLLQILGFGLVLIAAYRASLAVGTISFGIVAVAVFWFVWKPFVFALTGLLALVFGNYAWPYISQAAIGAAVALALFSPIALLLAVVGAYIGRRRRAP
jgi:hypothetical protein